jgi:hypothetical protein
MSTPAIRIGDHEREAAVRELGGHFTDGRLDAQEYEERTTAAYAARTGADLEPLFADLPWPQDAATVAVSPWASAPAWAAAPASQVSPEAPYGRDPVTGQAYSDRNKVIAGLLQLFLPIGVGRFYTGHTGIAVAQLLLSFLGIGVIWAFIDGIVLLAGDPTDPSGHPLRP